MRGIPAGSVDAIITDLPYGTTACKWDEVIPFVPMWEAVKHVLKPRGVFVTTASQPRGIEQRNTMRTVKIISIGLLYTLALLLAALIGWLVCWYYS